MSDSVSNADIEDVLSSIRRLVSEEPKSAATRLREPETAEPERFVLTPAFRVPEDQTSAELHHLTAPIAPEQSAEADQSPEDVLHDILELDAHQHQDAGPQADTLAVDSQEDSEDIHQHSEQALAPQITEAFQSDEEWSESLTAEQEPVAPQVAEEAGDDHEETPVTGGDENGQEPDFDHLAQDDLQPGDSEPEQHEAPDIEPTNDSWAEAEPESQSELVAETEASAEPTVQKPELVEPAGLSAGTSLESRIAELEAALAAAPQEWEPDGSEDGTSDETRPISADAGSGENEIAEILSETAVTEDASEALSWEDANDDQPLEHDGERAEFAVVDASEIEAVEDGDDDPDPASLEEQAGEQLSSSHAAEVETIDSPDDAARLDDESFGDRPDDAASLAEEAGEGDALDDDGPANAFLDGEEGVLDEEGLRELVSDLVRQELQGVLGERITRNVRRLVRREIQRAMTMRDLE